MAKIITFANQKGGVGKSSVCQNFGAVLLEEGHRVLYIDLDPQRTLTRAFSEAVSEEQSVAAILRREQTLEACVVSVSDKCGMVGASNTMRSLENELVNELDRDYRLKEAIETYLVSSIKVPADYILIDTPPALGLLSVSAFTATDEVIIITQPSIVDLAGVADLKATLDVAQQYRNPNLVLRGILFNGFDSRTNLAKEMFETAEIFAKEFDTHLFETTISKSVDIPNAYKNGKTVLEYKPQAKVSNDYRRIVSEYFSVK